MAKINHSSHVIIFNCVRCTQSRSLYRGNRCGIDIMNKALVARRIQTKYLQSLLYWKIILQILVAQLVEFFAWGNSMCFGNDALIFARDSWNNKLFVKPGILNQMYTSIVYMYMRRLFCMPYANFMGQSDCLLCVWCISYLQVINNMLRHSATRNVSEHIFQYFLISEWQSH